MTTHADRNPTYVHPFDHHLLWEGHSTIVDEIKQDFHEMSMGSHPYSHEYFLNGKLHRVNGPAIDSTNGHKSWFVYGKLSRNDGPAFIGSDGSKKWYFKGKLHREHGPALILDGGRTMEFWENGKRIR